MRVEDAIAIINSRPDLVFKERDGKGKGKGWVCPLCGSGSGHGKHKEGTGVRENPKKPGKYTCFANAHFDGSNSGDVLDWIAVIYGTGDTLKDKLRKGCELAGIEYPSQADWAEYLSTTGKPTITPKTHANKVAATHSAAKVAKDEISDADKAKIKKARQEAADYIAKCQQNLAQGVYYLEWRCISLETAKRHGLGYDPHRQIKRGGKTLDLPVIVTPGGSYYTTRTAQDCDKEHRHDAPKAVVSTEKTKPPINLEILDGGGVVFICEGVFDMLSVEEAGGAAVSLNSASNTGDFLEMLDGRQFGGRFIIALDNDDSGEKAAARLEDGLKKRKITYLRANVKDLDANCKDLNDLWVKNQDAFREWVKTATSEALALPEMGGDEPMAAENIDAASDVPTIRQAKEMPKPKPNPYSFLDGDWAMDSFLSNVQTEMYKLRPTGIDAFDKLLNGGFLPGDVVLVGGQPGLGKTAILQWIVEHMIKHTPELTGLYLCFEMSRDELIARSLRTRLDGKYEYYDILQGFKWTPEMCQNITEAATAYRATVGKRLMYNPVGSGDVFPDNRISAMGELLKAAAQAAEKQGKLPPIVVCDYIQLLQDGDTDTKKTIGHAMEMLCKYAKKYKTIVLAAMANNRSANKAGGGGLGDGRDSSNLEYGATTLLQLKCEGLDDDGKPKTGLRWLQPVKGRGFGVDKAMYFDFGDGIVRNPRTGQYVESEADRDVEREFGTPKDKVTPIGMAAKQRELWETGGNVKPFAQMSRRELRAMKK